MEDCLRKTEMFYIVAGLCFDTLILFLALNVVNWLFQAVHQGFFIEFYNVIVLDTFIRIDLPMLCLYENRFILCF